MIELFPNPTKGSVMVRLTGFDPAEPVYMEVFGHSGQVIAGKKEMEKDNVIDLSRHPAGNYILRIRSGGGTTEWKIVKM
ncbi:MAG: T9SS type A sorting domain-containing protein [Bacteroidetes bacterium]|nr:T9SS type A sorting domain-containing protein [Bacteroidota bacterium]